MLRTEVENFLQNKVGEFEQKFQRILEKVTTDFDDKICELRKENQESLLSYTQSSLNLQNEFGLLSIDFPKKLHEQDMKFHKELGEAVRECKAETEKRSTQPCPLAQQLERKSSQHCPLAQQLEKDLVKVKSENQRLLERLQRVESTFGGQGMSWKEVVDMCQKMRDMDQRDLRKELDMREKKVIDVLVRHQSDERF